MRPGVGWLVVVAAILRTSYAHACSCIVDADAAKQRARQVANANVVFRGRAVRQTVLRANYWHCDYSDGVTPASAGCLKVATYGPGCVPMVGVKVVLDGTAVRQRRTGWSKDPGSVEFCDLGTGAIRLVASAIRFGPITKDIPFVAGQSQVASVCLGDYPSARYRITFTVGSVEKGQIGKRIEVETWDNQGTCGFGAFRQGGLYEVFARRESGADAAGMYIVDLCGGTHLVPE